MTDLETEIANAARKSVRAPFVGQDVVEARRRSHGDFEETAQKQHKIYRAVAGERNLGPAVDYALQMICAKLARIGAGDPKHADHWLDIAGYATLVHDHLTGARLTQTGRASG